MKCLLVPIISHEGWRALQTALVVARRFQSHVDAIFIQDDIEKSGFQAYPEVNDQVRLELIARLRQQAEDRVTRARSRFEEIAQLNGVTVQSKSSGAASPSASLDSVTGQLADVVGGSGSVYDAIIMARPEGQTDNDWRPGVEAALFSAGRPVLLTPSHDVDSIGEVVVIGWNRTAQSARAMFAALPFLTTASRVVIVSVETGAKEGPAPEYAARNLAWHGVTADIEKVPRERRPVAETLSSKAQELGADLLVIGAYSHSRFREMILGGVTRHVFRNVAIPVLMAH